jgi:hypothetical protein
MAESDSLSSSKTQVDSAPIKLNTWRLIRDKSWIIPEGFSHRLPGSGTETDPYLVEWRPDDVPKPHELFAAPEMDVGVDWRLHIILLLQISFVFLSKNTISLKQIPHNSVI